MRSATPPYNPKASSPSFVFLLRALKDNGRADEVQAFFDDVCATQEVRPGGNHNTFDGTRSWRRFESALTPGEPSLLKAVCGRLNILVSDEGFVVIPPASD